MSTRCNWCGTDQTDNLEDTCTSCKREGYLMDTPLCGDHIQPITECPCLK